MTKEIIIPVFTAEEAEAIAEAAWKQNKCVDCGIRICNTAKRCIKCNGLSTRNPKRIRDLCKTRIYRIWANMKTRCYNKKDLNYKKYGAKGIKVCKKWKNFAGFYEDMGEGYKDNLTLDRIDNNKGYSKENCRWATYKQQANNKTSNRLISYSGMTKTLAQWSEFTGLHHSLIQQRLKKGWTKKRTFTEKPKTQLGIIRLIAKQRKYKRCKMCEKMLKLEKFYNQSNSLDNKATYCKLCNHIRNQKWKRKNRNLK
jgi:hypothetical protein